MKRNFFLFLFVLLSSSLLGQNYGIISISVADMKLLPDYQSETVSQSIMGTPVRITGRDGYWNEILTPEGYQGWVTDMNVEPVSDEEFAAWRKSDRVIITVPFALLYEQPDTDSQIISDGIIGNIVQADMSAYESSCAFLPVTLPDGRLCYISKSSVTPFDQWILSRRATGENITSCALDFLGVPYVWGGMSSKGFDCSGFVKTVYFLNGIILLRDASQQVNTGKVVDFSDIVGNLEPGDLVFFGRKSADNPNPKVTHVGLYLEGGKFIHSSLRVRINTLLPDLPDSYTSKSVVQVRRIIGCEASDKDIVPIKNHPWYFENNE